ncbi:MAG TPA: hypothetical protein VNA16_02580 [Abditibacteriaceae bacterium]|nr:hypothetical protein [Abditibacteriaceae bacterium]
MTATLAQLVEQCVEELRRGALTEAGLRRIVEGHASNSGGRQDLLYLQASNTSVQSGVHGMLLVQNGELSEGPPDPDDWPYQTVLEAMRDGWRVIAFPNLALLLDDSGTYGLGCEFILEKWIPGG